MGIERTTDQFGAEITNKLSLKTPEVPDQLKEDSLSISLVRPIQWWFPLHPELRTPGGEGGEGRGVKFRSLSFTFENSHSKSDGMRTKF